MSVLEGFKMVSSTKVPYHTDKGWEGFTKYRCTVKNPRGKTFSTVFYMGSGHGDTKPTLGMFMGSVVSDAQSAVEHTFEQWVSEFGWDTDDLKEARRVRRMYEKCVEFNDRLEDFLTEEEREAFLYEG